MYNEIEGTNEFGQTREEVPTNMHGHSGMQTPEARQEEIERKRSRKTWMAAVGLGMASLALIVTAIVVGVNSGKTVGSEKNLQQPQQQHQQQAVHHKQAYKHYQPKHDVYRYRNCDRCHPDHDILSQNGYVFQYPQTNLARRYVDRYVQRQERPTEEVHVFKKDEPNIDVRHVGPNWYYHKLLGLIDGNK